ncbi:unnamed protein product [Calypogeia fissa]
MAGKTVAVTGATGFIASLIVKDLLERGYTVRGTVRKPDDTSKVGFLLALPGAKERLTLHKADLLEEGSFDSVVDGVDGVFHTASPLLIKITDPQVDLIDPAVKGTMNLLEAAAKAKSVKRVVITGSGVAIRYNTRPKAGAVIDETWWSDPEYCRANKVWYVLSKTLAEKDAWDFMKVERHFDLVVMNPTLVLGKMLQPTLNTSSEMIGELLSGAAKTYKNVAGGFVDVQDVSLGHILAYENPKAQGRYMLTAGAYSHKEICAILHKMYPDYPVPTEPGYDPSEEEPKYKLSTEKAQKELGMKFRPIESLLTDCVTSLQQLGWLNPPQEYTTCSSES